MDKAILKCVSWNVNSLMKRATDVHSYVLDNNPDVIVLQETGVRAINFQLSGYQAFELSADVTNNTRGLVTLIKNNIPATFVRASKNNGTEILCVMINMKDLDICIVNVYIHADKLDIEDMPDCIFTDKCLLMGDMNARHPNLGTLGISNRNGNVLHNILNSLDDVKVLGIDEPTHVRGGRLDYAILFNMVSCEGCAEIVRDLLSDHFAIRVSLDIEKIVYDKSRKVYHLKDDKTDDFKKKVSEWYKTYKNNNGHGNDENKFYEDLMNVIDKILDRPKQPELDNCNRTKSRYVDDKVVKGWCKLMRKAQSKWSKNPSDHKSKEIMLQIADCTTEMRKNGRGKYWNRFLEEISFTKSLSGIWNGVNKVRGIKRRVICHPNPKGKADELMSKWAASSSFDNLPNNVQACLRNKRTKRRRLVMLQSAMNEESDVIFTKDELLCAVKRGKSTAPGEDGITYKILNCLISMESSPLLDLFNLSYMNGRLPIKWKIALIVPVPKGNGDFRPISLTSCMCKMMERLILNRLMYVIGDQLSHNLYGFLKEKSTSDCIIKVLSNSDAKCRVFVDLKGAFDRANADVILEELVSKGVKGKLLKWLDSYLSDRKAKAWFQGSRSDEMKLDLGTPQGGVLSPMLFNVLMDKIARHVFPINTQIIVYADDIVIQCNDENKLRLALAELQNLCMHMGLVINENKSKYQSRMMNGCDLKLNGIRLEKVQSYKYLGMYIGFNKYKDEIDHLKTICTARMNPLRVLANKGNGAGIPVLRMVYISTVRAVIDYAAPMLILYGENELKPLEILQNQAMRIILGCPRSTRIEVMRLELNLPTIFDRINELAAMAAVRLIRNGDRSLKMAVDRVCGISTAPIQINSYARKLCKILIKYQLSGYCVKIPVTVNVQPWITCRLNVSICKLSTKKSQCNSHELKQLFLSTINSLPRTNCIHIFCDGSVNGGRVGCGIVIREYFLDGISVDEMISKRIEDNCSTTTAELIAIYEGLNVVANKRKDIYIFSDSQGALYSLNSSVCANKDVVMRCKDVVSKMQTHGNSAFFFWIPSHIGIRLNEQADSLAKEATDKTAIDIESNISISRIKKIMFSKRREWETENIRKIIENGSESLVHYLYVLENTNVTYGKSLSKVDTMIMRLRLGYRYVWEYTQGDGIPCKLCNEPSSHTLHHYMMECYELSEFRNRFAETVTEQVCYLINNVKIKKILKKFESFKMNV